MAATEAVRTPSFGGTLSPLALTAVPLAAEVEDGGFHAPSVDEFFPGEILFEGTIFAMTRITLVQVAMTTALVLVFFLAFRKPQLVPKGIQNLGEVAVDFVQVQIVDQVIGSRGQRFLPYLCATFFFILFFNFAGVVPLLNIAGTSIVVIPLMLAVIAWVVFNTVGIRANGLGNYLKTNLFPPGVPKPLYVLLTPIEFLSTFVLRPITLTIRLMANMMSGHFLLVLFYAGATYLLFHAAVWLKPFGVVSAGLGFVFVLFEMLVEFLQAYIFTLLVAVYIQLAMSTEH